MLKIKDNIDLKELKKYGFYKPKKSQNFKKYVLMTNAHDSDSHISICNYDGTIRQVKLFISGGTDLYGLDILYDLIQNGLVEKVSDGE